jgi:hypothetical protein
MSYQLLAMGCKECLRSKVEGRRPFDFKLSIFDLLVVRQQLLAVDYRLSAIDYRLIRCLRSRVIKHADAAMYAHKRGLES